MSDVQLDRVSTPTSSNGQRAAAAELPIWRVTPQCDLYESDAEFLVVIDMPGATVESLSVQIIGTELELRAQRAPSPQGADVATTTFERSIQLPAAVDADSAAATLQGGVLEIRVSKAASSRRVKIPVNTN